MADPCEPVTACVIIIGDEVLSGRTRDANLPFLARSLNEVGIRVAEARVIPDDRDVIVATVNACRARHRYVFTTGGIGPTHDDITAAAVADAFGVALERNPEALARLRRQYSPEDLNEARLKMADVPAGATLIDNPVSQSPGFRLDNVYVLPGVPRIMQAMFDGIRGGLRGGDPVRSRSVAAFTTEGSIAGALAAVQARHPRTQIGSYPFVRDGRLGTSLVIRSTDPAAVDAAVEDVKAVVRDSGAEPLEDPVDAPAPAPG